jgi:protein TonB
MNAKATIALSAVLHLAFVGYLYTLETPESYEVEESTIRRFASVQMRTVRPDEISEDGTDDPSAGVPNPTPEAEQETEPAPTPETEPEPEPEPEPKPTPEPEPEPETEPEPEPEPEPESDEELKSVVTDKTEDSDSPVETDSEARADAKTVASTAPVDSGGGGGGEGASSGSTEGASDGSGASGARGIRGGTGEDNKKLNQKYGLVLYRELNKTKSYPRFARKAHIEGDVLVAITVDRSGEIKTVELHESSGHKILDKHTVESIRKMKRLPVPPDAITWKTKTFVVPVSYKLR